MSGPREDWPRGSAADSSHRHDALLVGREVAFDLHVGGVIETGAVLVRVIQQLGIVTLYRDGAAATAPSAPQLLVDVVPKGIRSWNALSLRRLL